MIGLFQLKLFLIESLEILKQKKRKNAKEFLAIKDKFDKIGFEIIGTKDINNEEIYLVKKKKSWHI